MSTMTKWAVGVVAVFGLMVGVTSKAAAVQMTTALARTAWTAPLQLQDGRSVEMMVAFNAQGEFLLIVGDKNGAVLSKITGTYQVVNGYVQFMDAQGKIFAGEYIVSVNAFAMVTKNGNGQVTNWSRLPVE